jgi:MerR family transcriptional regulator, copper efflux regulator
VKIGQLAGKVGVGVETIRYYERRGLLTEPARTPAGYREYAEADVLRLRFILRCKELGFSLTEIRDLLELRVAPGSTADDVRRRAADKVASIGERIADLERIRAALRQLIGSCSAHGRPEECALMHALDGDRNF